MEKIDTVFYTHFLFIKTYQHFCKDVLGFYFDRNQELIPMTDHTGTCNPQYLDTLELSFIECKQSK